jgi:hypothetical protein
MYHKFKIGYQKSIMLIALLLIIAIISVNALYMIQSLMRCRIRYDIITPISYVTPFVIFFLFIKHHFKTKKIKIKIADEPLNITLYPLIFFMIICGIIITEELYLLIPKNIAIFNHFYKHIEHSLEKQVHNPYSLILSIVFLAPVCEELLFRGLLLNGLMKNKTHPIKAIIFTSFLFGLTHMNPWQFIGGLIIGSIFGLVFFCTRSIYNCIFLHSMNNLFASCMILNKHYLFQYYSYHNIIYKIIKSHYIVFVLFSFMLLVCMKILIEKTEQTWKLWYK